MKINQLCLLCIFIFGTAVFGVAEPPHSDVDELSRRFDGADAIEDDDISHIAESAYLLLSDIPENGWSSRIGHVKKLIALRKQLESKSGVAKRHLALTLQECLDVALLNEVRRTRRDIKRTQAKLASPLKTVSDQAFDGMVSENGLPELEYANAALALDCPFAHACRASGVSAQNVLLGKVRQSLSGDLRKQYEALVNYVPPIEGSEEDLSSALFVRLLVAIDRARDRRLLARSFRAAGGDLETMQEWLDAVETIFPHQPQRRIASGMKNDPLKVLETFSLEVSDAPGAYELKLAYSLLPHLKNQDRFSDETRKALRAVPHGQWLKGKK